MKKWRLHSFMVKRKISNEKLEEVIQKYAHLDDDEDIELLSFFYDKQFTIEDEIELEEKEIFFTGIKILNQYEQLDGLYYMFIGDAFELLDYKNKLEDEKVKDERRRVASNFNRLIINFISNSKLFIEFTEQIIKKEYPNKLKEWKKLLSEFYDESFVYRFFYHLRNYTQHRGLPLNKISYTVEDNHPTKKRRVDIFFNTEHLMEGFSWKPILIEDFKKIDGDFNLSDLFDDYFEKMTFIYGKSMELFLLKNDETLKETRKFLEKYDSKGKPYLYRVKKRDYIQGDIAKGAFTPLISKMDIDKYYVEMSKIGLVKLNVVN